MKELVQALEEIERNARGGDPAKVAKALEAAVSKLSLWGDARAKQLGEELSVWKNKLPVIWKEPAGRQGMAKHARHWIGKLNG